MMPVFMLSRSVVGAALGVACALLSAASLSAQTTPATSGFTPAQVKATTSVLDARVEAHPKRKAAAAVAKSTSASVRTDASTARALRTPVPAVKAVGGTKKR